MEEGEHGRGTRERGVKLPPSKKHYVKLLAEVLGTTECLLD